MKNMHLLGILAGLGLLSATICFLVIVRENSNIRRLDELTVELQQARDTHRAREDQLAREFKARQDQLDNDVTQVRKGLLLAQKAAANDLQAGLLLAQKAAANDLQAGLESAKSQLITVQKNLDRVSNILAGYEKKEWLAKATELPPWKTELQTLDRILGELTTKVKNLETTLKKDPKQSP